MNTMTIAIVCIVVLAVALILVWAVSATRKLKIDELAPTAAAASVMARFVEVASLTDQNLRRQVEGHVDAANLIASLLKKHGVCEEQLPIQKTVLAEFVASLQMRVNDHNLIKPRAILEQLRTERLWDPDETAKQLRQIMVQHDLQIDRLGITEAGLQELVKDNHRLSVHHAVEQLNKLRESVQAGTADSVPDESFLISFGECSEELHFHLSALEEPPEKYNVTWNQFAQLVTDYLSQPRSKTAVI
jgi:hypothetical protein